jgi:glutathione peroxidase
MSVNAFKAPVFALLLGLASQGPLAGCGGGEAGATAAVPASAGPVLDHAVKLLDGRPTKLSEWRGHALLIVNTASECGLTPQYEDLEALHQRYQARGLVVMAFPCNDFGGQEPGDAKTIGEFVARTYGITFPIFEKQSLKGTKSPLWKTLTEELPPGLRGEVKWNFSKFLVNPDGRVVARFDPATSPLAPEVTSAVERVLPPSRPR